MKNVIQKSLGHQLMTLLVLCAMVFTAASCSEDDESPLTLLAPTVNNATAITTTGFTISWAAVTGAAKYQMDVSTVNTFATTVTGYDNKDVTGTTTNVTGLTAGTTYYVRVYAVNGSATSVASATKTVATTN